MEEKLSYYINRAKTLEVKQHEKVIRVAVLSSFTLNGLEETLRVKCDELNVNCITFVSGYNQYNQEIFNEKGKLYEFNPDITFLILDVRDILDRAFYAPYSYTVEERKQLIARKISELENLIGTFIQNSKSKLVLSNSKSPGYSPYGIVETKTDYGIYNMITDFNSRLAEHIRNQNSVFLYDFNAFVNRFGDNNVFDYRQFFIGDIRISFDFIPALANDLIGYVKPLLGLNKKCIVLDLDNTLWGGIIGEDGFEGISLGDTSPGNAFVEFQQRIFSLWKRGIILAINSKNNPDDALQVIKKHPAMILHEEHFAAMKINWNDKISNFKELADELNIGLSSMVFIDDDPVNREMVKTQLPEVLVLDLPNDPSQYAKCLIELNDFNILSVTEEDLDRGKMYFEQKQRTEFEKSVTNLDDFLKQLDIKIKIKNADEFTIPRISQLTLKTNQFNLTTRRYQEEDIRRFTNDKNMIVGCAQVEDKFGDNGITGVFIIKKDNETWEIDTFLLSCRVMGRGVENGILGYVLEKAKGSGAKFVKCQYVPTKKNIPCQTFLEDSGFDKKENEWIFDLNNVVKLPKHLTVKTE
jgi:FkbH-like protein